MDFMNRIKDLKKTALDLSILIFHTNDVHDTKRYKNIRFVSISF